MPGSLLLPPRRQQQHQWLRIVDLCGLSRVALPVASLLPSFPVNGLSYPLLSVTRSSGYRSRPGHLSRNAGFSSTLSS
jgi:hypothetical protein